MPPLVSLSMRSAKKRKLSCSVRLAGQVDCILSCLAAGCCACAENASAAETATALRDNTFFIGPPPEGGKCYMKITRLETLRLEEFPNLVWLRVHTDEGLVGLGDTSYAGERVGADLHEYVA